MDFSVNPQNIKVFHLSPHLLLKVTKFLLKISQFEFFVMTGQKLFLFINFFVIKYSRFWFIFYWKSHPLFPSNPPLKTEVLQAPSPFWKFGRRLRRKGGAHFVVRGQFHSCVKAQMRKFANSQMLLGFTVQMWKLKYTNSQMLFVTISEKNVMNFQLNFSKR